MLGFSGSFGSIVDPTIQNLTQRAREQLLPHTADADEVKRIFAVIAERDHWRLLPRRAQQVLIGYLAARLRVIQERLPHLSTLDTAFSLLSGYSQSERPGFIWGLSRSHIPKTGTWENDARLLWDELATYSGKQTVAGRIYSESPTDVVNPERVLLDIEEKLAALRKAPKRKKDIIRAQVIDAVRAVIVSRALKASDPRLARMCAPLLDHLEGAELRALRRTIRNSEHIDDTEDTSDPDIPVDWPFWGKTQNRDAIMVGGSPREPNRARLEAAFRFASLEWVGTEGRRTPLMAVRNCVESGGIDLIIILRDFIGHNADQIILPACRAHGVDWAHVRHGYGVAQIKQAIERFLND